jgi:hypothetical protein
MCNFVELALPKPNQEICDISQTQRHPGEGRDAALNVI